MYQELKGKLVLLLYEEKKQHFSSFPQTLVLTVCQHCFKEFYCYRG